MSSAVLPCFFCVSSVSLLRLFCVSSVFLLWPLTAARLRWQSFSGAGLAPHLDKAHPRWVAIEAKGSTTSGRSPWVLHGRATSRRGLGVVWPEKDHL
jgi:hypothetical protein